MTKKMKSKEVVPHASPKTNSKAARARRSATRAVPIAHWDERDIHFDDQGRVIIRNQALAQRLRTAMDEGELTIVIPPPTVRPIPNPPPPVDTMCYCRAHFLRHDREEQVQELGLAGQVLTGDRL
jgi:hypothetical protein